MPSAECRAPSPEPAPGLGIGTLTFSAFSSDNWQRPLPEVSALMELFRRFLEEETARSVEAGVALNVIGRRDRLPTWGSWLDYLVPGSGNVVAQRLRPLTLSKLE